MTTTTPESRGEIAYLAYCRAVSFTAHNGEPLPAFDGLGKPQRDAWIMSARAIWELATTGKTNI